MTLLKILEPYIDLDRYPAGRELDALVAQSVLGWRIRSGPSYDARGPTAFGIVLIPPEITDDEVESGRIWPPLGPVPVYYFCARWSTELQSAWRIVEHMLAMDWSQQPRYLAFVNQMNEWGWCAPVHELCRRICRAALKAMR